MTIRPRYHHGDLRSALLDAAADVLAERGVAGLTLRECARRAGVSHAAPAHHFGSVSGLFTALATRGFAALVDTLARARAAARSDSAGRSDSKSLDADLAAIMRAYVDFARAEPERFRLMFRTDLLDQTDPDFDAAARGTYAELTNVIRLQRGEAPVDETRLAEGMTANRIIEDILMGWCHIHGLAHLLLEGQLTVMKGEDEEAFLERLYADHAPRIGHALRAGVSRAPLDQI